jgi:alpha-L-fucosidase
MLVEGNRMADATAEGNDPERLEWFRDLGLGLFIHWSIDTSLGSDVSHPLVGASDDFVERYYGELPRHFKPRRFDPVEWAELADLIGVKYVVFTTKHHNGFCMFATATTERNVLNTPFGRDTTAEIFDAFRAQGIVAGTYFSPDDFAWLWENGIPIQRNIPSVQPAANPGLMDLAKAQLTELLTDFGRVDLMFFDGEAEGLREHVWQQQPDLVVTRGAIPTPEQYVPGQPIDGPWESNLTMGTQWTYKPTNETYKSGTRLIQLLIETRAKGGNLLLNIGPKADGTIPVEQEARLQELGLWMFVNREAIYGTRPWVVTNEGDLWFTMAKDGSALYVAVTGDDRWKWGERREFLLRSVKSTAQTAVSVLGQNGEVMEYRPEADTVPTWRQTDEGLVVSAMNTHRLYNDKKWPNPVVIRLANVEPAAQPTRLATVDARWNAAESVIEVDVETVETGTSGGVQLGVEYQDITGMDTMERPDEWSIALSDPAQAEKATVPFAAVPGHLYAVRALGQTDLLDVRGAELKISAR